MNPLFSFLERLTIGPAPNPAEVPVLDIGNGHRLNRRDLTEAILVLASVGKGKTTLANTLVRALLRDRSGGLVLAVKASQITETQAMCAAEGRQRDLIVFGPWHRHVFNPLTNERNSAEAAALIGELAEVLSDKVRDGGENDAFWRTQLEIILRNLLTLCRLAHGRHDLVLAAEMFDGRANSLAELADPVWQKTSAMAAALDLAHQSHHNPDARLAIEYFTRSYPCHGDRLQGSLAATVSGVFDHLRRSPLREMFTGESTFSMDSIIEHGKICVVALPVLDSAAGRIANALMQFCFCRSAPRQTRRNYTFLLCDECQETISRELMRKMALLREYKVASIMLTQNLAVLDERIGETTREAFCGLAGTKIFGAQSHAATRQWAAEQIGKRKTPTQTTTTSRNTGDVRSTRSRGTSVHEQWDYRVSPLRFAELKVGETICLRDGQWWMVRWHRNAPGKAGTVAIVDD